MRPILLVTLLYSAHAQTIDRSIAQDQREFTPRQVVSPVRPITDPPISKLGAEKNKIADSDLVLGVLVGKEARAYPINMLTGPQREIINDKLGGRAIAATW